MGEKKSNKKNDRENLSLDTRKEIYDNILKNPGLHLRKLIRKINASEGTVRHHIKFLKKNSYITEEPDGNYSRFYVLKDFQKKDMKTIHALRKKTQRNIILYLSVYFFGSQIQISKELNKNPKTIEYHLKILLKEGLIEKAPTEEGFVITNLKNPDKIKFDYKGRNIFYRLKKPYEVYDLLFNYKENILDDISEPLEDYIFNLPFENNIGKNDEKINLDDLIFVIYKDKHN